MVSTISFPHMAIYNVRTVSCCSKPQFRNMEGLMSRDVIAHLFRLSLDEERWNALCEKSHASCHLRKSIHEG